MSVDWDNYNFQSYVDSILVYNCNTLAWINYLFHTLFCFITCCFLFGMLMEIIGSQGDLSDVFHVENNVLRY